MSDHNGGKILIRIPDKARRGAFGGLVHALEGMLLSPWFCLLAISLHAPGMRFRAWCLGLGLRSLSRRLSLHAKFHLLFMPMESTRYFEFAFAVKALEGRPILRYLDVSSPRLMPLYLLDKRRGMAADLINPNPSDLEETARLVELMQIGDRCRLHGCLIADAPFAPATFDVITSISVLEHIPEDLAAVQRIWELLKPGGVFVLTVPCMAKSVEQYMERDEWGLLDKGPEGQVFWQRLYDWELLQRRVFSITGQPQQVVAYGEKIAGALLRNTIRKRSDPAYPYWREPYMMAREYRYFDQIDQLPGEGVIGLLFVKSE